MSGRSPSGVGLAGYALSRCASHPKALIPCAFCGKALSNLSEGGNQPGAATEFVGGGDYGSAITDDYDRRWVLNVCDPCLRDAGHRGVVATVRGGSGYHLWGEKR